MVSPHCKKLLEVYNWDALYPTGIANVANNCHIGEIMQYMSNYPKMTSVIDQLTPSHPSLCNIVSCLDLLWGKGSWLCQVCGLDSEQANEIALHQIKIASLAQPRKHSIVARPYSSWEGVIWGQDYCNWECHTNIWETSPALFMLSHTNRSNMQPCSI